MTRTAAGPGAVPAGLWLSSDEAFSRAAEPWEVASTIAILASDYSNYLTGEVISVSSQRA